MDFTVHSPFFASNLNPGTLVPSLDARPIFMNRFLQHALLLLCLEAVSFSSFAQQFPFHPTDTSRNRLFSETGLPDKSAAQQVLAPFEKRFRILQITEALTDFSGAVTFNLFHDVQCSVQLQRQSGDFYGGMQVWTGRTPDARFDHLPHYINTVVVVNPETGNLVANLQNQQGWFQVLPTSVPGQYRIRDCKTDPISCELLGSLATHPDRQALEERSVCGSACLNETDANGKYVIDIFIGFSNSAAAAAGDFNAYAQAMVTSVNTGLTNSLVTDTWLRLVGTGTTPNNPGVVTSVLDDCYNWFATPIETTAPDLVSVFQTLTGASGEAGGWGYVGGYSNVNNIGQPNAFRHEIGHNAGGGHCPGDGSVLPYAHGFDTGNWRTHLCGNSVNFFSTPAVNDDLGQPIGDAATADMARTWRERAQEMAQRRLHRIPFFTGDECVNQICIPSHLGPQIELVRRVVFNTIDNNQTVPDWNCPTTTGYSDYTHLSTTVTKGETYPMTIMSNYSWPESNLGVWIDWNNDGILSTAERVINLSGNGPWSQPVLVPLDAVTGPLRLRIRLQYGEDYVPHPCDGSGYTSGETEDYTVAVASALPVELVDFQGVSTKGDNLLSWRTAREINTDFFEIERSQDATGFVKIGKSAARGMASSYSFADRPPVQGTVYYRLKMVDRDGTFQYSQMIALGEGAQNGFALFPNPASEQILLRTDQAVESDMQVSFWNAQGQKVLEVSVSASGAGFLPIDVRQLPAGVYQCRISDGASFKSVFRVVKN